ncbi:MAG: steroid reductase, partial [Lachnospiraceae bacterium]|nr:steroid reductase [Lachnospiraceae bacterium]
MGFLESFGMGFLILILIALVVSSIGFYKYVYFISLGYGFSVAAMGVALFIMYTDVIGAGTLAMCVLFLIYG